MVPPDLRQTEKIMPSFRNDLSEEQIDELVTLIMEGDWDYVYNQSVLQTGHQVAQLACREEALEPGEAEACDHIEVGDSEAPPVYPTAPAPEVADPGETAEGENTGQDAPAEEGVAADADAETADVVLEAIDPTSGARASCLSRRVTRSRPSMLDPWSTTLRWTNSASPRICQPTAPTSLS